MGACYHGSASPSPLLGWLAEGSWVTGQRDTYRYVTFVMALTKGPKQTSLDVFT